jgi:hypothetical protein
MLSMRRGRSTAHLTVRTTGAIKFHTSGCKLSFGLNRAIQRSDANPHGGALDRGDLFDRETALFDLASRFVRAVKERGRNVKY